MLDAFEQFAAGFFAQPVGDAVLLELVENVGPAREVAEQDALAVADGFGRDMLVGRGILEDRADVDAALVREGAVADVGLLVAQRQVGQFGDEAGGGGQVRRGSRGRWWCGPASTRDWR